ncbi:hypothetical protein ABC359_17685, partial [Vibrio cholerae]|uniref:hypothetical protein n=1 Tax=Vibrio cholerae TaxID=666 RepID=UPI0031F4A0FB
SCWFIVNSCQFFQLAHNARLRGWQRITQNSNTTTLTTAAQWDWKRHALTVPLEAFVMLKLQHFTFELTQE